MENAMINFSLPQDTETIIKVIGVGGGGGNAVTHMYRQGINEVSFALCNTDLKAMNKSEVPVKLCLGPKICKGLGAGNDPDIAKAAAEESEEDIRKLLSDGTQMVFITAGMGGGTGTGAAPVIAGIARSMDILTVGIVTIPFLFEGRPKIIQALNGVEEMGKNVDALLVINNEKLRKIYRSFAMSDAFNKADDTLTTAAKSIAEIITLTGYINLDFADVNTTLKNGGVALIGNGYGEGEGRLNKAIEEAFNSPLIKNDNVIDAEKILFNISSSHEHDLKVEELDFVNDFMTRFKSKIINVIWGTAYDDSLGEKIKFTVLASGFRMDNIPEIKEKRAEEHKRLTEDQLLKEQDLLKKEKEEEKLIGIYYGDVDTRKKQIRPVSRSSIVVLTFEEMCNDEIVTALEEYPTYNRDRNIITQLLQKIAQETTDNNEDETSAKSKKGTQTGGNTLKISFK